MLIQKTAVHGRMLSALMKITLATFLKLVAWIMVVLAVALVSTGLFILFVGDEQWPSIIPVVATATATAGVFLAVAGHFFAQAREVNESREKRSLFYMEACLKAYEEARDLLADGNNDRRAWIAAGRALGHAKALARDVTQDAHLRVLELHRLKYRGAFHDCLTEKTAAFFYGSKDHSLRIDEAAAAHTAGNERAGRTVTSTINELAPASIRPVWEAAQWPEPFHDPLGEEFTDSEQARLMGLYYPLYEFLEHRKRFASASGKLFPK